MKDKLLLAQKPLVDKYLQQGLKPLSSFSFVSIFAWSDFFDFECIPMGNCLCVFARGETGCFLYLPPLGGDFNALLLARVFTHMAEGRNFKGVNRVENIPEYLLSAFGGGGYNLYRKPGEYIYLREDLANLSGQAYKSQRHDCNYFLAHYPGVTFEAFKDQDYASCMALYERWAESRASCYSDCVYQAMLEENRLVHARLLSFGRELGLVIRVLKVRGKLIGYTFGFVLDADTFCVYAEITDLTYTGAAAYIFKSLCQDVDVKSHTRINTMDDFAMPNVQQAKGAYHPLAMAISYTASPKQGIG